MSDSGEDDLPDISIGNFNDTSSREITRINVDAEIADSLARKERIQRIKEAQIEFEEQLPELPEIRPLPVSKICNFPPNRQIFESERSLKSFNADTLTTQHIIPSEYTTCTTENVDDFFSWIRSKLKNSSEEHKRQFLQYLWLLNSCHPDPYVVQKCYDMLVDYNLSWRLKYDEVILVLYNWGVSPRDLVSDLELDNISATLNPLPTVSASNVENVLQILNCQLMVGDLEGTHSCRKAVFLAFVLLTLDQNFCQCLSDVHKTLEHLAVYAKSENPHWVENYCEGLFEVETHHARLSWLIECVVPESMRWCICLAHCQQVFSLQQSFQADPEPVILQDILLDHIDKFLQLDSWELYTLISIVDAGISQAITLDTDQEVKRGFLDWLNQYMERRIERRTEDIDVDAVRIAELVSRLQTEWENTWLAEAGMQNISVREIENDEMDVDDVEQD